MQKPTIDRRVRKTKLALKNALISLMKTKSVNNITVKELCAECDINRGTFYLHYQDVTALLFEIETETMQQMAEMLEGHSLLEVGIGDNASPILRIMYTFLAENANLCRAMLSPNGDIAFVERVKGIVREKFMDEWRVKYPNDSRLSSDFIFTFIVSGTMGVLQDWLMSDMPISAEKMAEMIEKIIVSGVTSLVE